jgi:hypothetical protein
MQQGETSGGAEALGYSKRRAEAKRKGPRAKRRGPWRRKRPRVRVEGQEEGPKGWPKQGRKAEDNERRAEGLRF